MNEAGGGNLTLGSGDQIHPGYSEVSRRKKVDRTVPNFILDSTKFGTLYLYRTEVFTMGLVKK